MKISIEILSNFEICYNFGEKEIDRFKFSPPKKITDNFSIEI